MDVLMGFCPFVEAKYRTFFDFQTDLVFRLKYDELKLNGTEHIGFYSESGRLETNWLELKCKGCFTWHFVTKIHCKRTSLYLDRLNKTIMKNAEFYQCICYTKI